MKGKIAGFVLSVLLPVAAPLHLVAQENDISAVVERLKSGLAPLDLNSATDSADTDAYLKFYSLAFDKVEHCIGTMKCGDHALAAQVFQPQNAKGTVILSHGYYDHAGVLKHLIRYLIESGYAVAVLDHAGHGLSSGTPAAIDDFGEYVVGLNRLIAFCSENLPAPLHLAGHSMGCAVIIDLLLNESNPPVENIVLLAPLVRSVGWKASGLGLKIAAAKLDSVPRKFRKNSSDPDFLTFHKQDPLQARKVPLSWVAAHRSWYDKIQTTKPCQKKITIIQGTKDSTVDWKYNLKFLQQRMPNADVITIKDGGHQLLNEASVMRQEVMKNVIAGISKTPE